MKTGRLSETENSSYVLLVEDDATNRETIAQILWDEGYTVVSASNGEHALAQIERNGPPSLILLDLMMPEMDGIAFSRALRNDSMLAGIPMVMLSASLNGRTVASSLDIEFLAKPMEISHLLEIVGAHASTQN